MVETYLQTWHYKHIHTSTDMALMEEATRHPGTFSFSVSCLGTRAASSPFCVTGLGSEGCEVVFAVDSLGEDSCPLRMVSVNNSLLEFEEAGVILIEVAVGEKDKEERSCLGLVSSAKVPMQNWPSSNLATWQPSVTGWAWHQWASRLRSWPSEKYKLGKR